MSTVSAILLRPRQRRRRVFRAPDFSHHLRVIKVATTLTRPHTRRARGTILPMLARLRPITRQTRSTRRKFNFLVAKGSALKQDRQGLSGKRTLRRRSSRGASRA